MNNIDKADAYVPNPEAPKVLAMKNTNIKELAGVETWYNKDAPEFLTILLTVFI